jgi:outer membrane protein assembly factor BamB
MSCQHVTNLAANAIRSFGVMSISLLLNTPFAVAQQPATFDVTTHHYDPFRTGWNSKEVELTPSNIRSGSFGLIRPPIALDEQVDAQPLIVTNVTISGKPREVVYVATENNTIYAIDASTGDIFQKRSLGIPVSKALVGCGNNGAVVGITGTPVIDRASDTIYVVTFSGDRGQPIYHIHALDLASLQDKIPSRVIAASAKLSDGSSYDFNAQFSRQRAALVFANGNIYAAFGSFCDHHDDKTRGWILGWRADTLQPLDNGDITDHRASTVNNYYLSSIWMSGSGPAVDESGNLYFITGNSRPDNDQSPPSIDPKLNLQESIVKMDAKLGGVLDYFTPSDLRVLDKGDLDFGSGGILLIPGGREPAPQHLVAAAGKSGEMFLLDRDKLGKFDPNGNKHILAATNIGGRCWCAQSYYFGADNVGRIVSSGGNTLSAWKILPKQANKLVKDWDAKDSLGSGVFQKGFFTSVSSNGTERNSAVVWAVQRPSTQPPTLALWAFDAMDGSTVLAGVPAGRWPNTGGAANAVPVVANGRVYVASYKELRIFGRGGTLVASEVASDASRVEEAERPNLDLYGTVVGVEGSTLWLRTSSQMVRVDIAQATANHETVTLTPGNAVLVKTTSTATGSVKADAIEYAPDSPALWPAEK